MFDLVYEPLEWFLNKYAYSKGLVQRIACGEKYLAVMHENGNIGVCATLMQDIQMDQPPFHIDLSQRSHRVFYNAYINSIVNYESRYEEEKDIFDKIPFDTYNEITMIGYFTSLVSKFLSTGISLHIFDKQIKDDSLEKIEDQQQYISRSDALILTSTSVFNQSFNELIAWTNGKCDVFLLGPSSILHPHMKTYGNIKYIFGAVFNNSDHRVMDIIDENGGTKIFLPLMRKVYI